MINVIYVLKVEQILLFANVQIKDMKILKVNYVKIVLISAKNVKIKKVVIYVITIGNIQAKIVYALKDILKIKVNCAQVIYQIYKYIIK